MALNQHVERDADAPMVLTQYRPIPAEWVAPTPALATDREEERA